MRNAAFAILCGVLLALAFPPWSLWPLAWVVPGLLYVLLAESRPKPAAMGGYLFGVALYLLGAQWVRALAVPLWLLLPLFPSPVFALYGLVNGLVLPRLPQQLRPVVGMEISLENARQAHESKGGSGKIIINVGKA